MEDKKLTFEEIMILVEKHYDEDRYGINEFADEGMYYNIPDEFEPVPEDSDWEHYKVRAKNYADTQVLGLTKCVDSHGGMGEGEDYWRVHHFVKHDIYIKISGWYASHHGTDFEDGWGSCKEVKPEQETITVYK